MKSANKNLTHLEACIIRVLTKPYGVEKTVTDIVLDSGGVLKSETVLHQLEALEFRGYLKSRHTVLPGYLIKRRIFQLDHVRLYDASRKRLQTRLILDKIISAGALNEGYEI